MQKVNEFRTDNTNGYSQIELDSLNNELADRLAANNIDTDSVDYQDIVKQFSDEVARR